MCLSDVSARSMMLVTEDIDDGGVDGSWGTWSQRGSTKRVMHSYSMTLYSAKGGSAGQLIS